jgi:GNAT superfamily N-acetyltransferase
LIPEVEADTVATMTGVAPPPLQTVRRANADDVALVSSALARAFYDDPVMSWLFRDDSRRMRKLEQGFALFMRGIYLQHEVSYTTDGLVGGALWAPPGKWHLSIFAQLRLFPGMLAAAGRDLPRMSRAISFIESSHPQEPHYYLGVLGVTPEWQGKGLGAALMRPILELCDREGVPAYLEASSPGSRDLYLRNGFEVVEETNFPRGGPPTWFMWRAPRTGH